MVYLDTVTLPYLQRDKNLLAFSGGVDSTALFFLLFENRIAFDIALVNYTMRPESDQEEAD
ncbi:MAG TPA: tRNA lysidine(34) synthetase TilS, partial [Campylobacterales bacterium]|nr:tRNA lysidine(34) synthetase TilS [Campylobacterales bacterium]